jgi:dephospho-CoA kinase
MSVSTAVAGPGSVPPMLVTGLTGGIGSGKSTVAAAFAARGAAVVDADVIARQVVQPGGAAYDAIVERFGPAVLRADGAIDRPALAAVIFSDPADRAALDAITHPAIGREISARVRALGEGKGVVVLDVPLLDRRRVAAYGLAAVVVVDVPEELALARLVVGRGFTEADARARIAAQISREERRRLVELVPVGAVVDNAGDLEALEARIDEVWTLLAVAASRSV